MKHIPTFNQFINESYNRTSNKYKTQPVELDDIEPGDYIADGPNVGEVSRVISNTKKGFTLNRVWNNVRKKDGEEFFVPHDLEAMKDHQKSIIRVENFVNESTVNKRDHEVAVKLVAKLVKENPTKYKDLKNVLPPNFGTQDVEDAANESMNEALAAVSMDKLTVREPLSPKVNATLISNARNGILKSMKEPGGKTHYWNPKTKEYIAFVTTYNGKGEYWHSADIDGGGNLMESTLNEGFTVDIKDIHFETDPIKQIELKKAYGKSTGAMSTSKQIESADYSLAKFRREIGYNFSTNKNDVGIFYPSSFSAASSKLGNGPHAKKQKVHSWNQRAYDKWIKDMSGNGGAEHGYDMAQNAKNELGLLDWVKKNLCDDETPLERIQWDIEAHS